MRRASSPNVWDIALGPDICSQLTVFSRDVSSVAYCLLRDLAVVDAEAADLVFLAKEERARVPLE